MHRDRLFEQQHGAVLIGVIALVTAVQVAFGAFVVATYSWAQDLEREQQLLPGTQVAGVDVGGMDLGEARKAVDDAVSARADQPVTVVADGERWQVHPADVGVQAAAQDAIEGALAEGSSAGWLQLAQVRWMGGQIDVDAPLEVADERLAAVVRDIADDFDREPRDAALTWSPESGVGFEAHRDGRRMYRNGLAADLAEAMRGDAQQVEADVNRSPVEITTEEVEPLVADAGAAVERSLNHDVTISAGSERWTLTPTDVGAEPDMDALLADALDGSGPSDGSGAALRGDAPLVIPEEQLASAVEEMAAEVDVPARNAEIDWSDGWVDIDDHETGEAVDRDHAVQALDRALRGDDGRVRLSVVPVEPERSREDYEHVLLLRKEERKLYHYVDGNIRAEWPVAVGAGGSPTPSGVFHIGAKREQPTWYNPDPDGWGSGMPDVIEPGKTNPLGVRALNWNKGGADTLIRFHGTAVESSIGEAASKGCVRLTNPDVVELFDRIPQGTTIVSITA